MIPRIQLAEHRQDWQEQLASAVRSVEALLRMLDIEPTSINSLPSPHDFPLRVPLGFVRRMARGDPRDPLLLQVLPVIDEGQEIAGFYEDPLEELDAMSSPGLLHKYRGRALLTLTGACAIHCRYCFRRHFPYTAANPRSEHWQATIDYLRQTPDISELILSGGDPLTLTDSHLYSLSARLSEVQHLRTLRIHTRLPVVLPARVDKGLLAWIRAQRLRVVIVIHCNHPNEIDQSVIEAAGKLASAGATLLNQSVLLRKINDDIDTLTCLSERLFDAGILPYYLHQMDRVKGAAHFEVDIERARELDAGMRARLPGYLVPRLVQEIPGEPGKTLLQVPLTN